MRFSGHGNALAISISVLALVAGGTGAAVATTSTTTISDPDAPAHIAHVDSTGRLTTTGPVDTISSQGYFNNAGVVNVISATNASIAITQVALSETLQNAGVAGSDLAVRLVQDSVDENGACTTTAVRYIALTSLGAGDHVDLASSVPFVVKPIKNAKYCIGIYSSVVGGATDVTNYYPFVTLGGYVAAGSYTGVGTSAMPAVPLPKKTH